MNDIILNIASHPPREKYLHETIKSLVKNKFTVLNIYLNGYNKVPEFEYLDVYQLSKLNIYMQPIGDIGDKGKFYKLNNSFGYYFTCDDDIIYPVDYTEYCVQQIEKLNRRALVGFHATIFNRRLRSFYKFNTIFYFFKDCDSNTPVHMLGTGTMAFHTETMDILLEEVVKNMTDVYVMKYCQKWQVPQVTLKRSVGYLREQEGSQDSAIWKQDLEFEHYKVLKSIAPLTLFEV